MVADTLYDTAVEPRTLEVADQGSRHGFNFDYRGIVVRQELRGYKVTCLANRNPRNEGLEFLMRAEDWPQLDLPPLVDTLCQKLVAGVRHEPERSRVLEPGEHRGLGGSKGCVGHILPGLRADIMRHRKYVRGKRKTYYSAAFFVDKTNESPSHRLYSVGKRSSFEVAYTRAIGRYSEVRKLEVEEAADALLTMPSRNIFQRIIEHRQLLGEELPAARLLQEVGLPMA
tara:strand:+ start:19201 stop:19884 length:684 start_codon:yes stop_codon:yes gene_type:complete